MKYQGDSLATFPNQINFALSQFQDSGIPSAEEIDNIIIAGLGGSGIAARISKAYFQTKATRPIEIVSDYSLPSYTNHRSLVICSSYSGNTEETLSCFKEALAKNAKIVVLSSGGEISRLAVQHGFPTLEAEPGYQPRMALGYSLTYLLLILDQLFDLNTTESEIRSALGNLKSKENFISKAGQLASTFNYLSKGALQILADGPNLGIAIRFQQQLNENAKKHCQVHEVPEMCHNVIEAITGEDNRPYLLLTSGQQDRNNLRFDFLRELLNNNGNLSESIKCNGYNLSELLENIYTLDWLSLVIADHDGTASDQIPNILNLKAYLSER